LTVSWLVSRQTILLDEEESVDSEADDENSKIAEEPDDSSTTQSDLEYQWVGFNGRCNKVADTCYEWWALGSLAVKYLTTLIQIGALWLNADICRFWEGLTCVTNLLTAATYWTRHSTLLVVSERDPEILLTYTIATSALRLSQFLKRSH